MAKTDQTLRDEEIISLYEKRDEDAIRKTAEAYGTYCQAIAERILGDHEDAEECVSDAYLRAWRTIPPEKPSVLRLYLAKLTRSLALNRYKEKRREKRGGGEIPLLLDELAEVVAGTEDMEAHFRREEMRDALDRFFSELAPRERSIFLRRYFYAEDMKKLAAHMGMREEAVRMSLSRTRQKLKTFLTKEELL